jgi:hypothetical protein
MDQEAVDMMVDPTAFKLIDKARRYDQAQNTAKTKITNKKTKASKKTLKSKTKSQKGLGRGRDSNATLARLRETGDPMDAAAAMMARWAEGDDD